MSLYSVTLENLNLDPKLAEKMGVVGDKDATSEGSSFWNNVIEPSFSAIKANQAILAAGNVVGKREITFIGEFENNDALDDFLESLPIWIFSEADVKPLVQLETRSTHDVAHFGATK